jgi:hopene-associated glycosyltransferase HpnB
VGGLWTLAGALSLAIWLYLIGCRGGFWRLREWLEPAPPPAAWPEVVAIVPARDEAANVGEAIRSLLRQDYPGRFAVVLADDRSRDGTAEAARRAAADDPRLTVVRTAPLPPGWNGKVWAMATAADEAARRHPDAAFLLFTDADIRHPPDGLRRLVAKAEAERLDLVSLMVLLVRAGAWQALLIPAFVFFFRKLYPFARVNAQRARAAAGGCMLVRVAALRRAGGLAAIGDQVIDDCALARTIAAVGGRLWLGLTAEWRSLRPYDGLAGVWRMVVRSAYTQLGRSPAALIATVLGMAAAYLAPPVVVLAWPWHGDSAAALAALAAWAIMALAFLPMLRFYGARPLLAPLLPLAGLFYASMTVDSAWRHWRGRGAAWKGRTQPP